MAQSGHPLSTIDPLPFEQRAALDVVARFAGADVGLVRGTILGDPRLARELRRYGHEASTNRIICLMADSDEVKLIPTHTPAREVITVTLGPFEGAVRPFRVNSPARSAQLTPRKSARLQLEGFQVSEKRAIQGPGSAAWAIAARIARRIGRPDLADRCRIAMFRTLVASRPFHLGALVVTRYERPAP
jgi:hypothetical protein